MPSAIQKRSLAYSSFGMGIPITFENDPYDPYFDPYAVPGTPLHIAVSGSTIGTYDEIWIQVTNIDTIDHEVTIAWGDQVDALKFIHQTIPAKSGLIDVVRGLILNNSMMVYGMCDANDVLIAYGYVNRITN